VTAADISHSVVEQYRTLVSNLHQAQLQHNVRVLMVGSALPGEGKTLVASNVALTLAESFGRRVLLVDADFRKPSLQQVFGLAESAGLADYLANAAAGLPVPVQISTGLSVVAAGSPRSDSMRTLTNGVLDQLVSDWAGRYDWVVIDTPPVALLADANVVAAMADRIVFVIEAGKTAYDVVQASIDALGRERIFGCVLNHASNADVTPYGARYDQYYRPS